MKEGKTELMIQLSYKCNLNCVHCAYGDIRDYPELLWYKASDFLWKYQDAELIKISGGEPSICSNYSNILRTAKNFDAKVIVFTNGQQDPDDHPDSYWVSLFGNKKIHNSITQADTFDRTLKFIKDHEVEYLNSPVFSREQMKSLRDLSWKLDIPLRITRLIEHGACKNVLPLKHQQKIVTSLNLNEKPNWITCSLGFEPARCYKKICLKPDGKEVVCTAVIRGKLCPFRKKIPSEVWHKLFEEKEVNE